MSDKSLDVLVRILTEQVGSEKAADVIKQYKEQTEEASHATEQHNKHLEGGRALFAQINKIAPGVGESMRAMFEGPLGPLIILSVGVNELLEHLKKYSEELDKQGDEAYQPHLESVHNLQAAWDDAKQRAASYAAKLAHLGEDKNPLETARKHIEELRDAQIAADKLIIESNLAVQESWIRRIGAMKGLSSEQVEAQIKAAKSIAEAQEKSNEHKKDSGKVEDLQAELEAAQKSAPALNTAVLDAQQAVYRAELKKKADDSERDRLRKETEDVLPGDIDKLPDNDPRKIIQKYGEYHDSTTEAVDRALGAQRPKTFALQNEEAEKELNDKKLRLKQLENKPDEVAAAGAELESRQAALDAVTELMRKLPGEIAQAIAVQKVGDAGARRAAAGTTANDEISTGIDLANAAKQGQATRTQIQTLLSIAADAAGHNVNLATAIQMMESAARSPQALANLVTRLTTILSAMDLDKINQLDAQIKNIEAQLSHAKQ